MIPRIIASIIVGGPIESFFSLSHSISDMLAQTWRIILIILLLYSPPSVDNNAVSNMLNIKQQKAEHENPT